MINLDTFNIWLLYCYNFNVVYASKLSIHNLKKYSLNKFELKKIYLISHNTFEYSNKL